MLQKTVFEEYEYRVLGGSFSEDGIINSEDIHELLKMKSNLENIKLILSKDEGLKTINYHFCFNVETVGYATVLRPSFKIKDVSVLDKTDFPPCFSWNAFKGNKYPVFVFWEDTLSFNKKFVPVTNLDCIEFEGKQYVFVHCECKDTKNIYSEKDLNDKEKMDSLLNFDPLDKFCLFNENTKKVYPSECSEEEEKVDYFLDMDKLGGVQYTTEVYSMASIEKDLFDFVKDEIVLSSDDAEDIADDLIVLDSAPQGINFKELIYIDQEPIREPRVPHSMFKPVHVSAKRKATFIESVKLCSNPRKKFIFPFKKSKNRYCAIVH